MGSRSPGPPPSPQGGDLGPSEGEDDPLDRLLDEYSAQAAAEAAAADAARAARGRRAAPRPAAAARAEALAAPLPAENKGFALLSKMGYRPGQGLGRGQQGRAEPVPLVLKSGRAGLGVEEARAQRKREAEQRALEQAAKRQRHAAAAQHGFKGAQAEAFALRKLRRHAAQAAAACASLDERAGVTDNPLLPSAADGAAAAAAAGEAGGGSEGQGGGDPAAAAAGRAARRGPGRSSGGGGGGDEYAPEEAGEEEEAGGEGAAGAAAADELGPEALRARLAALVEYLRASHGYCLFCGAVFQGAEDMAAHCPGPGEEDHDG
ncbi:MAG: G-patch domain-containing protein [Monoraphidium minutum]|nr:MAG: G-patch domain-containing protein [Monoraphidium minutum]